MKSQEEIEKMKRELQEAIRFGPLGANERLECFASGMIYALEWVLGELEEGEPYIWAGGAMENHPRAGGRDGPRGDTK
jgi:hypothetical protein